MFVELGPEPSYTRQKPPEWDNLIDLAADTINPSLPPSKNDAAARAVWQEVIAMPVERCEDNRYYGLGLPACDFARTITSTEGKERLIRNTTTRWINNHPLYASENGLRSDIGLYLGEIKSPQGSNDQFREVYEQRPFHERLVINSFSMTQVAHARHDLERNVWQNLYRGNETLDSININVFAGASKIMRLALMGLDYPRGDYLGWDRQPIVKSIAARDLADTDTIAGLDLTKVSVRGSALRLDEFREVEELLKVDEEGLMYVDPRDILKEPGPIRQSMEPNRAKVLHEQRFGCPALFVTGLIPLVVRTLPQVVVAAQKRLLSPDYNEDYIPERF